MCSSKRVKKESSKACYFDQVYKDNYQQFFYRERKDTGVNIIDN